MEPLFILRARHQCDSYLQKSLSCPDFWQYFWIRSDDPESIRWITGPTPPPTPSRSTSRIPPPKTAGQKMTHRSINRSAERRGTRRRFLDSVLTGTAALPVLTLWNPTIRADEKPESLNRFPRMVHEFFVEQVRKAEQRHLRALDRLKTKADAEAYVRSAQARIRKSFGPEPKRTPLNARVTGTVERDTYRIENVIFESRSGFPVTANLYVPKGRSGRLPAVVGTCGHSTNGKAETAYQSFAQGLARLGYVCLIYDPIGQGERLQYVQDDLTSRVGVGVREHLHAGNQQFLVGEKLLPPLPPPRFLTLQISGTQTSKMRPHEFRTTTNWDQWIRGCPEFVGNLKPSRPRYAPACSFGWPLAGPRFVLCRRC